LTCAWICSKWMIEYWFLATQLQH